MSNQNRVIFITGASAGIGKAMAIEYGKMGYQVALVARRLEKLKEVRKTIEASDGKAIELVADVRSLEDLKKAVKETNEKFGPIDTVVANAGFYVEGKIEKLSLEELKGQFDTNIWGVLHTFYATLDDLKKTKGRFAIMSSAMSYFTTAGAGAYTMSKYAIRALAETLDLEMRKHEISVTHICPGLTESDIHKVDNFGVFDPKTEERTIPPHLIMPAPKAARQMIRVVEKRKHEVVTTKLAKCAVFMKRHFPRTTRMMLKRFPF